METMSLVRVAYISTDFFFTVGESDIPFTVKLLAAEFSIKYVNLYPNVKASVQLHLWNNSSFI